MTLDKFRETFVTWDKASKKVYQPLRVSGSDEKGRKIVVQVVNDGVVEDLTGVMFSLYWKTRKGVDGLDPFTVKNAKEGIFELFYTNRMLQNVGVLMGSFVLVDATGRIVSEEFNITVTGKIDDSAAGSQAELSLLSQALSKVSEYDSKIASKADKSKTEQSLFSLNQQLQQKASLVDLKITDSRIDGLIANAGDGTIPSELSDLRVGADGVTYSTAGEAVRTQLEEITKGAWNLKNEIVNGDFSNPDISHITSTLDLEVVDGKLKASKSNWTYASGATIIIQNAYSSWDEGDIYYVKAMLKVTGDTEVRMNFGSYDGSGILTLSANDYRDLKSASTVFSPPTKNFAIRHFLKSAEYVEIILDNIVSINLTKTFGAGNEPTKEEMDELLELLGGWFEGAAKESLVTLWKFATSNNSGTLDSILTTENETWEVI